MEKLKYLGKYILIFISLIVIYFSIIYVTSLIPSTMLENNVKKSSETLETIKNHEESLVYNLGYKREELFLFTDALMINTAYSIDNKNPVESMLLDRKSYIPGQTTVIYEEGKDVKSPEKYMKGDNTYQTKELYGLMHNDGNTESFEYPRYWHGYLAILRPLLLIFDYSAIRILSCIVFAILNVILFILIWKRINIISAICYFVSSLSFNIFLISFSLNEITTFYIAIISSIILLLMDKKVKKYAGVVIFITGSITSFIDLFTTPIVTIGIPLIIYFLILQRENKSLKAQILDLFKLGIIWGLGYGLTWASKWIITDVILQRHILQDAITQILFRTSEEQIPIMVYIECLTRAIVYKISSIILLLNLLFTVIVGMIGLIKNRKNSIQYKQLIIYLIITILPIAWFIVVRQHSSFHIFFTYRMFIITIFALQIAITKLAGYDNIKQKLIE